MLKMQAATFLKVGNTAHFNTVPTSKNRVTNNIKHLVEIYSCHSGAAED
jgi:hypothetical protein